MLIIFATATKVALMYIFHSFHTGITGSMFTVPEENILLSDFRLVLRLPSGYTKV